jgi:4-amino-4-deoxy-L-arabinose transferase-like glycosyltransferase
MNKATIWLILIVLFGFFLRFYQVSSIPPGLNRDEAAIGYTAYSILKTGRDEFGRFLPVSLESFGDWKLPLYVYFTTPFVAIFQLTELTVRLPSVLFGTLTIITCYFLTIYFLKRKDLSLLSAFLLAISPWHIFFSRVTSEANLAVFLVSLGVLGICYSAKKSWYLPLGTLALALSLLAYHGNHVFTPLLFLALIWIFRKDFKSRMGGASIILFLLIAGFIFNQTLFSADKTKISGLLSLNDISLVHEQIDKNRVIYKNPLVGKIFNNKIIFTIEQVADGYIRSFSPEFLFIKGGGNQQHNIPDFGNLYLVEAPFLLLGLVGVVKNKEKFGKLLIYWLLISPIGASLTKDAPHSARMFAIFPALPLITAYGIIFLLDSITRKPIKRITTTFILLLFFANTALFFNRYFVLFPYKSYASWGFGQKEMIEKLFKYKEMFANIIVGKPENSPYIYYLFYQKSDPRLVQTTLVHYPPTDEGFVHVKSFDGILYQKINWTDELLIPDRLYVDYTEAIPKGATNSAILITKTNLIELEKNGQNTDNLKVGDVIGSRLIDQVLLPDTTSLFSFIETFKAATDAGKLP